MLNAPGLASGLGYGSVNMGAPSTTLNMSVVPGLSAVPSFRGREANDLDNTLPFCNLALPHTP